MKKLLTGGSFFCRLRKIQILLFLLILAGAVQSALFAQSKIGDGAAGTAGSSADGTGVRFRQRLEWSADKNAFEYKVEIRSGGKTVKTFTTADNFVNLNLPAGNYDYRVTVYDFLGREQDVSAWQKFEISKANEPVFNNVEENVEVDVSAGKKIVLPVEVDNVAEGASVVLVNVKTGSYFRELCAGLFNFRLSCGTSSTCRPGCTRPPRSNTRHNKCSLNFFAGLYIYKNYTCSLCNIINLYRKNNFFSG